MRKIFPYAFIVTHALCLCLVDGYKIFSMRELGSCTTKSVEINLGSLTSNSSGILVQDFDKTYVPRLHCVISLLPPFSYGIVASIKYLDLQPATLNYTTCQNYLEISPVEHHGSVRLCGYSFDEYEFQSYINWRGRINIVFHTSNSSSFHKAAFQLTFTAVRKGHNWCSMQERRCHNGLCIWKGLACDGHNNCGDLSDELNQVVAQCGKMSTGESLGVILITIVGSLTLLVIAAYFKGAKISQQIERLSGFRRSECPQTDHARSSEEDVEDNAAVSTIDRLRTAYGSRRGLLSSYSYSDDVHDPPPPYETVQSSPAVEVTCSVTTANNSINNPNTS